MVGEKELMISTRLPMEYIEGDDEVLETSFQALEIVGTTSTEVEGGGPKLSKAAIKADKVLIGNGFQLGKGLGKGLDGIAELRAPGKKWIRSDLYSHFISGGIISLGQIAAVEDQPPKCEEWVVSTSQELDNWTAEALPELVS
ncbi:hypothetical protein CR513_51225, partial [Mucuna pruriens]